MHLVDVAPVRLVRAVGAAQHPVGVAHVDHHGADQRLPAPHLDLGELLGDALALGEAVILGPVGAVTRIVLGVDDLEIDARPDAQAVALEAFAR